jgi:citrate lyase beta subunit
MNPSDRPSRERVGAVRDAGAAIHPAQIAIINEVLTPTEEEVAKACQVLVVNRQGVGSVDGKMVDEANARKARLILERAPRIGVEDQVSSSSTDTKNNN